MDSRKEVVTVRLSDAHKEKILSIAEQLGNAGSLTAGLRWCVQNAPVRRLPRPKIEAGHAQNNRG